MENCLVYVSVLFNTKKVFIHGRVERVLSCDDFVSKLEIGKKIID